MKRELADPIPVRSRSCATPARGRLAMTAALRLGTGHATRGEGAHAVASSLSPAAPTNAAQTMPVFPVEMTTSFVARTRLSAWRVRTAPTASAACAGSARPFAGSTRLSTERIRVEFIDRDCHRERSESRRLLGPKLGEYPDFACCPVSKFTEEVRPGDGVLVRHPGRDGRGGARSG